MIQSDYGLYGVSIYKITSDLGLGSFFFLSFFFFFYRTRVDNGRRKELGTVYIYRIDVRDIGALMAEYMELLP